MGGLMRPAMRRWPQMPVGTLYSCSRWRREARTLAAVSACTPRRHGPYSTLSRVAGVLSCTLSVARDQEQAMRFGTFVFSMSSDPAQDHQVIEQTLREVELAEAIGMDAVWLTEHHFDGAVAYADPVVFAAAVAMRTHRVRIGFAVVEMALHHPVRLAVQTALVDNLSRGRLIVGTGRGSAYNAYEYVGFGTTLAEGREMLPEAEELLIEAWTMDDVRHDGRYWQAIFPRLRPRPYQKPHPPLVRA